MMKQYRNMTDIEWLDENGGHYSRHIDAMTTEDLHDKSDIAAELAWRDYRICVLDRILVKKYDTVEELKNALRDLLQFNEGMREAAVDLTGLNVDWDRFLDKYRAVINKAEQ